MTCHHDDLHSHPDAHDYRAATAGGDLVAFLHRHNRPLIIAGAAVVAVLLLTVL